MRRLARHLFTLAAAVSLLMCAAVCVMWARSNGAWGDAGPSGGAGQPKADAVGWTTVRADAGETSHRFTGVISFDGGLWLEDTREAYRDLVPLAWVFVGPSPGSRFGYRDDLYPRFALFPVAGMVRPLPGFRHATEVVTRPTLRGAHRGTRIPYWALAVAIALLPLAWNRRLRGGRRRARRLGRNRCPACDYDLRASPERCPECGATPDGLDGRGAGIRPLDRTAEGASAQGLPGG